ncbi:CDP-glycerol glycerophosphotransferase family protein [Demequina sp. NBRC 110051]|uniref:CDP-glycerol glycerophosphotransferase family protein n=1 Tax=Demequina sp. NBRC 110051 TaxID=1570340 RepID=UPI0013565ACB|nr:CDP-glycerol glycerophosphotransferase family protein [Demequina sp. NBRC 110051]
MTLTVHMPPDGGISTARLILVGRGTGNEIAVDGEIIGSTLRVDLPLELLHSLGARVIDFSLEGAGPEKTSYRARVSARSATHGALFRAVSGRQLEWYRTSQHDLSVRISGDLRPAEAHQVIAHLHRTQGRTEVAFKARPSGPAPKRIIARGWNTGVVFESEVQGDAIVLLEDDDLASIAERTVDLMAETSLDPRTTVRVGIGCDDLRLFEAVDNGDWRWLVRDSRKVVSLRRATAVESITASGLFDEEFYLRQVEALPDGVDAVSHYVSTGAALGLDPSPMFDTKYYRRHHPDTRAMNPLAHYVQYGWKDLRNPSPRFDTWWYWAKHLDLAQDTVMPLAHYVAEGKGRGLSTRPPRFPSRQWGTGHRFAEGQPVRRVCLFAAYDADGVVDDYVIDYVRELSRFADVYYLADSDMPESELEKLADITVEAWADRHGEYDFGSYKRLAERVGWERLETYDEMLLVNDSCYLLRPLDEVFSQMDSRACDWWGLQATKGIAANRAAAEALFRDPVPMDTVRDSLVDQFEAEPRYDFHVASYFLAYRNPVIRNPEFQKYLNAVSREGSKARVIRKYEFGLTRWLIQQGHPFDTFVQSLYPFHPVFSQWYFELLREGFPLLKRYLLAVNHYQVPRLVEWKKRILEFAPSANVDQIQRHLSRTTTEEQLNETLMIGTEQGIDDAPVPQRILSPAEFRLAEIRAPKHANWWVFPVCAFTENFSGNERAIFEQVKDDPSIRKIVLTRSKEVVADGANVTVARLESPEGQHLLMRAGVILIKHSISANVIYPVSPELHNIIQVWHGIPFKRIAYASEDFKHQLAWAANEHSQYRAVIASSQTDSLAMAASFHPLTIGQIWTTGLPRNDFILQDESRLPADMIDELAEIRRLAAGRRVVLFMPTFRNAQDDAYYRFSATELAWLDRWLRSNDLVLGVREHMADSARTYWTQLRDLPVIDLSDDNIVHPEMLYRVADVLVTDYSSTFIDFMLTNKPAISFAFDLDSYELERGGFYDLRTVFPGMIAEDFGQLTLALEGAIAGQIDLAYEYKRALFHEYGDANAASRVVARIGELARVRGLGKWRGERVA